MSSEALVDAIEDGYSVADPTCSVTGESLTAGDRVYLYLRGDDITPDSWGRGDLSAVERTVGDDLPELANKDQLVVTGMLTGPSAETGRDGERHGVEDVSVVDVSAGD